MKRLLVLMMCVMLAVPAMGMDASAEEANAVDSEAIASAEELNNYLSSKNFEGDILEDAYDILKDVQNKLGLQFSDEKKGLIDVEAKTECKDIEDVKTCVKETKEALDKLEEKVSEEENIDKLAKEIAGGFVVGQFVNPVNPKAHFDTTGPEIYRDTDGMVDILVATVGTGGTITGTGGYLKSQNPEIKVIAVEPASSPVLSKGIAGSHKIQGIGAGFIPEILDTKVYDEVITVEDEQAFSMGGLIGKKEGILVGISSGAALYAAIEVAKREENKGKTVVVILPDSGDRYLSTEMFA